MKGRQDYRYLVPGLIIGAFLSGCASVDWKGLSPPGSPVRFDRYNVAFGSSEPQTVLTGFLLGSPYADVAIVYIDENDRRRLSLFSHQHGQWKSRLDVSLRPGVQFVDVANIGGLDRLVTCEPDRLNWFDTSSAKERLLVRVPANYNVAENTGVPHVDITRDVNHDGRDDLVIPGVEGFWIATQLPSGEFVDPFRLGPRLTVAGEDVSRGAEKPGDAGLKVTQIPMYLTRVHEMDYNHDGRSDLVFWNQDHFDVYQQTSGGRFDLKAKVFTTGVPFEFEGASARAADYRDAGLGSLLLGLGKKTERTVLHSLRDLNNDRIADLVTLTLSGSSIMKQRSRYDVYFGKQTSNGTAFPRAVSTAIQPQGSAGAMEQWGYASQLFRDFDGDGHVDIMFRDVNVGIGGMLRTLAGNSVPVHLEFHCLENGAYPEYPSTYRRIGHFAPFAGVGNIFFPPVLVGDVNGDGRSDLIVGYSPRELHVHVGVREPYLFAKRPQKIVVDLPNDERSTWLYDLNRDGKQDVLIHQRSIDDGDRLSMLVAQ